MAKKISVSKMSISVILLGIMLINLKKVVQKN